MDVLFLTASTGGGHLKAAEAVKESVELRYSGSRCLIVDTLKSISPVVDRLIVGGYLGTLRNTPHIYGKLYKMSESGESITDITKTFSGLLSHKLLGLIREFKPSLIVCTHTLPLQMVSALKAKGRLNIPVVAIITDFVNHLFWKLENVDAFIVAHEHIRHDMIKMGLRRESIYALGIPVSSSFYKKKNRLKVLAGLDLRDKLTALIMGGSLGFGEIQKIFSALIGSERDIQIIALAGTNHKLKKQLESCSADSTKEVRVLEYTNNVSEIMDASDFIITKPGGVTVSEALAKELPLFLISPIPGQEEKNEQFLVNCGAAVRVHSDDNIDSILCQTLDNPLRVKHMKEMSRYLSSPSCCENIVNVMEGLITKKQLSIYS